MGVAVIVIIAVVIMVPVVALAAILRDTGLAERDQGRRLFPVADALHFGTVTVVHAIALLCDSYHRAADFPAAIGHVVAVQLSAHGDVAHEHEAGKGKQLNGKHFVWLDSFWEEWIEGDV